MESELSDLAPSDWPRLPIESVCTRVTSGGTPSRSRPDYYVGGQWGWVKTQELQDSWIDDTDEHITDEALESSSAKVLPANTLLLALYGATVGQLGILRREMTCNQACCAMVVDPKKADYRFLFYQLRLARSQLKRLATGAAQQNLSGQLIRSLRLPFPPRPEQQAIACVLGSLDDKIELNRRMNRTLEAMARAIFKSWFVDFDPVRAKAAARLSSPKSGQQPPGLRPEIAALFPDSFEDSELGEIPKGWRLEPLDKAAHFLNGLALQKYPPNGGGTLPVIKIAQLRAGSTNGADRCNVDVPPNYIVSDGDVLFSWRPVDGREGRAQSAPLQGDLRQVPEVVLLLLGTSLS